MATSPRSRSSPTTAWASRPTSLATSGRRGFPASRSNAQSKTSSSCPSQKVYLRPNWREVQSRPGKLDLPDWWQITFDLARQYGKRVGFRIMLENPDFPEPGMPAFLMEKVPYVPLKGSWPGDRSQVRYRKTARDAPLRSSCLPGGVRRAERAARRRYDGSPDVEYMDTMMYGFWGEGHTWPFEGNVFSSNAAAEQTMLLMLDTPVAPLDEDSACHQYPTRFQQRRQCRDARPHGALRITGSGATRSSSRTRRSRR